MFFQFSLSMPTLLCWRRLRTDFAYQLSCCRYLSRSPSSSFHYDACKQISELHRTTKNNNNEIGDLSWVCCVRIFLDAVCCFCFPIRFIKDLKPTDTDLKIPVDTLRKENSKMWMEFFFLIKWKFSTEHLCVHHLVLPRG